MTAVDGLTDALVPVKDLKLYPGNARVHDLDALAASLTANGQFRPLIVNKRTKHILKGNGTFRAAVERLGWTEIAVAYIDLPKADEARYVLVDNRASELGRFNDAMLLEVLQDLPDLVGTGYDTETLDLLEKSLAGGLNLLPPAPDKPTTIDEDARERFEHQALRSLVVVVAPDEYDQLLADLDGLVADGENIATCVSRLIRQAAIVKGLAGAE